MLGTSSPALDVESSIWMLSWSHVKETYHLEKLGFRTNLDATTC